MLETGAKMTSPASLALAFLAGFASVIAFHQTMVLALAAAGQMPAATVPWSLEQIPPFAVPSVVSKGFWGGLWAMLLAPVMSGRHGAQWWLGWIVLGATLLPLVAIFVVPVVKGGPPLDFSARYPLSAVINGAWGLGTALLLRFFGRGGANPA